MSSRRASASTGAGPSTSSIRGRAPGAGGTDAPTRRRRDVRRAPIRQQRRGTVGPGAIEQRGCTGQVGHKRRVEAPTERRGKRELAARLDTKRLAQRTRSAISGGAIAVLAIHGPADHGRGTQELVDGGQLGAYPGGVATGGLDRALGLAQSTAGLLGLLIGLFACLAGLGERGIELGDLGSGLFEGALQLDELLLQLLLTLVLQLSELLLDRADAPADFRAVALGVQDTAFALRGGLLQQLDLTRRAQDPLGEAGGGGGCLLAAQLQPLGGGAGVQSAA